MSTKLWIATMLVLAAVTLIHAAPAPTGCSCTNLASSYLYATNSAGSSLGTNKNCKTNFAFTYTTPSSYGTGPAYDGCNCPTVADSYTKAGHANGRYNKKTHYNYTSCHGFGYNVADNYGPTPVDPQHAVACCNYCCGYTLTTTTTTTTHKVKAKTTTTVATTTASTSSGPTPSPNNDAGD